MLLLAIDTSTPTVTAGVVSMLRPHELIAAADAGAFPVGQPVELRSEQSVTDAFAHAERLMPLVNAALAESRTALRELDAIVVGLGPGPFTGLRVGIATAAALGDALDVPVHGVGSHDATARAHGAAAAADDPRADFLVVTDARRREVYLSAYSGTGARLAGPEPVAPADARGWLAGHGVTPELLVGAGVELLAGSFPALPVRISSGSISVGLALAAARALVTDAVPGPLVPLYLRRPDAVEPAARKSVLGS